MYYSNGQIEAWYHSKISRILHGKRIYCKRYLTDDEVIKLCTGVVVFQEKIDGKLSSVRISDNKLRIEEDLSGKNTCHKHIIEYKVPLKRIPLDVVEVVGDKLRFEPFTGWVQSSLTYVTLNLEQPTLADIYKFLESLSKLPSNFGSPEIEGIIIKNYQYQLMGKWVNEKFEDKIDESEK